MERKAAVPFGVSRLVLPNRPLQQPNATRARSTVGPAPRRRGLRPRLLAAVIRSNTTSAFAAERQVVSQTPEDSMAGKITNLLEELAPQIERFTAEVRSEATKAIEPFTRRVTLNFGRCRGLVRLYRAMDGTPPEVQEKVSDILRAAVVFTHASVEDLLRVVAEQRMVKTDPSRWPRMSYAGSNQAEKIDLAQLAKYGTQTAQEIVEASLREYLGRTSFNRVEDIASMMKTIGLDLKPVEPYFPSLAQMMRRRHQIVHQADLERAAPNAPVPISSDEVEAWVNSATDFAVALVSLLAVEAAGEIVHGAKNAG